VVVGSDDCNCEDDKDGETVVPEEGEGDVEKLEGEREKEKVELGGAELEGGVGFKVGRAELELFEEAEEEKGGASVEEEEGSPVEEDAMEGVEEDLEDVDVSDEECNMVEVSMGDVEGSIIELVHIS